MSKKSRDYSKKGILAVAVVLCMGLSLLACSNGGATKASESEEPTYAEDSLYAYHNGLGLDWSDVSEVSASTCASSASCHGGDWEKVVESTTDMFEGVGQIPSANPHEAHATNAYECSDCHSLYGTSTLTCDECHNFKAPDGWNTTDPRTTLYGPASEQVPYTGDGVVDALGESEK